MESQQRTVSCTARSLEFVLYCGRRVYFSQFVDFRSTSLLDAIET